MIMGQITVTTKTNTVLFYGARVTETKGVYTIINEYEENGISVKKKTYIKNTEILKIECE